MNRKDLIYKVINRKRLLNLTIEQIANLTGLGYRTVARFFSGDDVKLSTVEKITNLLGLDFAGNETVSAKKILEKRAKQKALEIVSLVQDTSSLEEQGLDNKRLKELLEFTKNQYLTENKKFLWAN